VIALGCIADDFTGGTDVAAALRRAGLTVTLYFGLPGTAPAPTSDAVVIALKTRTVAAQEAVEESLTALSWLQSQDVDKVYFKYCSTFDSTAEGNIGPVTDALLGAVGERQTVICPASPEHGRTVYQGHLFVGRDLLSESSMRHHPLTPMTDANLVRVLSPQSDGLVGLLRLQVVQEGSDAVAEQLEQLAADGVRHVVVDAVTDGDLQTIVAGAQHLRLLTGGAGLAGALGTALSTHLPVEGPTVALPGGPGVVLAGSCSAATLEQVAAAEEAFPSHRLDPAATPDPDEMLGKALAWLRANWGAGPLLVYSSAGPHERERARAAMGPDTADVLERTLGHVAREAAALGAARIVVAGGETSGAVVQALDVHTVTVEGEADRGVPWCLTHHEPPMALLLKSGNFGRADLLVRSMEGALA
jgi:uncharacterized protein YgbK (DUF1537 family)